MGTPWCKHANGHAVGVLLMSSSIIIGLFCTLININSRPRLIATMGITTRASTSKDKPASRATIVTAATPKECRSKQLAKSPRTVNVNPLIAEINLPGARFDNILEVLCPTTTHNSTQKDNLNNLCDPAKPSEKTNQVTPLAFPMSVDQQPIKVSGTSRTMAQKDHHKQECESARPQSQLKQNQCQQPQPQAGDQFYSPHQQVLAKDPTHQFLMTMPVRARTISMRCTTTLICSSGYSMTTG
jgi:hypothetical protein